MKRYLTIFLISLLSLSWSCSKGEKSEPRQNLPAQQEASPVKVIDVQQAYELIQKDSSVVVIDVRTPQEFNSETGHVPGAKLMPVNEIEKWADELASMKDRKLVVICRSGNRSTIASNYLASKGFSNIYNVAGGMTDWNRNQLPVEKSEN
jgi:rhodanese-related sulfurtransferase